MLCPKHTRSLRKVQIDFAGPTAEHARREPGVAVANLLDDRKPVHHAVREHEPGGISARADDDRRSVPFDQCPDVPPRARGAKQRLPVVPHR